MAAMFDYGDIRRTFDTRLASVEVVVRKRRPERAIQRPPDATLLAILTGPHEPACEGDAFPAECDRADQPVAIQPVPIRFPSSLKSPGAIRVQVPSGNGGNTPSTCVIGDVGQSWPGSSNSRAVADWTVSMRPWARLPRRHGRRPAE